MGEAVARRLGPARTLVLADASETRLAELGERLSDAGHRVRAIRGDVSIPRRSTSARPTVSRSARTRHASRRRRSRGGAAAGGSSLSPGIIATPLGRAELAGPFGDVMRAMIDRSGTGRLGTPDDVAAVVEFLVSPGASFITGTDLLVDGGVVAAMRYPSPSDE